MGLGLPPALFQHCVHGAKRRVLVQQVLPVVPWVLVIEILRQLLRLLLRTTGEQVGVQAEDHPLHILAVIGVVQRRPKFPEAAVWKGDFHRGGLIEHVKPKGAVVGRQGRAHQNCLIALAPEKPGSLGPLVKPDLPLRVRGMVVGKRGPPAAQFRHTGPAAPQQRPAALRTSAFPLVSRPLTP